jgi:putative transposase
VTRFRCVDAQKAAGFPVTWACEAAGVSATAFYDWRAGHTHQPGDKERADAALLAAIRRIHADSDETYGSRRMTAALRREGWKVNHKRVERLMAEHGLDGHRPAKRRSTTKRDAGEPPIPDLVGRCFDPPAPDRVWCGDLSYIPTGEGWLYLATVIDLASRRLLGWSMSTTPDAQLMIAALEHAVAERGVSRTDGVIFHHDRGTQPGFKQSSQHLDQRSCDGTIIDVGARADRSPAVVLAWTADVVAPRALGGVLACHR